MGAGEGGRGLRGSRGLQDGSRQRQRVVIKGQRCQRMQAVHLHAPVLSSALTFAPAAMYACTRNRTRLHQLVIHTCDCSCTHMRPQMYPLAPVTTLARELWMHVPPPAPRAPHPAPHTQTPHTFHTCRRAGGRAGGDAAGAAGPVHTRPTPGHGRGASCHRRAAACAGPRHQRRGVPAAAGRPLPAPRTAGGAAVRRVGTGGADGAGHRSGGSGGRDGGGSWRAAGGAGGRGGARGGRGGDGAGCFVIVGCAVAYRGPRVVPPGTWGAGRKPLSCQVWGARLGRTASVHLSADRL